MERVPVLVAVDGPLAGRRFPIGVEPLRLGREPGNEVHIDDANVSRQHARVLLHNGAVWVQDAGSRNGVFVNGTRVADHKQVKAGDKLSVSGHNFEISLSDATAPAPRAAEPSPPEGSRPAGGTPRWPMWVAVGVAALGLAVWWAATVE